MNKYYLGEILVQHRDLNAAVIPHPLSHDIDIHYSILKNQGCEMLPAQQIDLDRYKSGWRVVKVYTRQEQFDSDARWYTARLAEARERGNKEVMHHVLLQLAAMDKLQGNLDEALHRVDASIESCKDIADTRVKNRCEARSLNTAGILHAMRGNSSAALKSFTGALESAVGCTDLQLAATNNAGYIVSGTDPLRAIQQFHEALDLVDSLPKSRAYLHCTGVIFANVARAQEARTAPDIAEAFYYRALRCFEEGGELDLVGGMLEQIGYCHAIVGNEIDAEKMHEEARFTARVIGDDTLLARLLDKQLQSAKMQDDKETIKAVLRQKLDIIRMQLSRIPSREPGLVYCKGFQRTSTGALQDSLRGMETAIQELETSSKKRIALDDRWWADASKPIFTEIPRLYLLP